MKGMRPFFPFLCLLLVTSVARAALPEGAEQEAQKFLATCIWTHPTGDVFSKNISDAPQQKSTMIWQFKGFKATVEKDFIDEVDKLNGIEWQGSILITATAVRTLQRTEEAPNALWEEWTPVTIW